MTVPAINAPTETDILKFCVALGFARDDEQQVKQVIEKELATLSPGLHAVYLAVVLRVVVAQFWAPAAHKLDDELGAPFVDRTLRYQQLINDGLAIGKADVESIVEGNLKNATSPKRVKVVGSYFRGQVPEGAVYVGRAFVHHKISIYANPHVLPNKKGIGCRACGGALHDRDEVIALFRRHLDEHPEIVERARRELAGRNLACWCRPDEECHADVWIEILTSS